MNKSGITIKALASLVFALSLCSPAKAQSRVFVSGTGNDGNPCSLTAPCRTFQKGHDTVAAGGDVVALDSAGYGTVSITKSVTITGEGVYAGITATSADGVFINSATAVVVLRNLSIYGFGSGGRGIDISDAASVHVENCVIQGSFVQGLLVGRFANSGIQTFVKDTVMRRTNDNEVGAGKAVFENCRFEKNSSGLIVFNGAKATLHNCVIAGNSTRGLRVTDAGSQAMVDNCQISNNGIGIESDTSGQVRVSNSQITNNTTGLFANAGTILSRTTAGGVTNTVEDNGTDGVFTGLYSAK